MAKPIYAGSYSNRGRGRWKRVFIIILLLHIAGLCVFFYFRKNNDETVETPVQEQAETDLGNPAVALPDLAAPENVVQQPARTPQSQAAVSDARAAIDGGQLLDAKTILDRAVAQTPDPDAIRMLGEVNMKLLASPLMMPGKEYYTIQGGDYLQKIAKKYKTTVALIKKMNNLSTDNIRAGARLIVFNSSFSIRVSKTQNQLDLMQDGKLFKRYSVGTGRFGKTPAVDFIIIDKIAEPPWTRPSDNKQIEFGDKENVLGTRWMALKSTEHPELTGFGIHGTWERDSIGKQSSAGCIRMLNEDVEELFDLVPRQTTVIIAD